MTLVNKAEKGYESEVIFNNYLKGEKRQHLLRVSLGGGTFRVLYWSRNE
jgi:hypothetical protein